MTGRRGEQKRARRRERVRKQIAKGIKKARSGEKLKEAFVTKYWLSQGIVKRVENAEVTGNNCLRWNKLIFSAEEWAETEIDAYRRVLSESMIYEQTLAQEKAKNAQIMKLCREKLAAAVATKAIDDIVEQVVAEELGEKPLEEAGDPAHT